MTLDEQKLNAAKEIRALLDIHRKEEERLTYELKKIGKFTPGLDGNSKEYALLNQKFDEKFAEIFAKYNLPPGTKLKLW